MTSLAGGKLARTLDQLSIAVALFATAYHFLTVWAVPHGATRHYTVHLGLMLLLVALATARRWLASPARPGAGHATLLAVFVVASLALMAFLYIEDSRLEVIQPWLTQTDIAVGAALVFVVLWATYLTWGWELTLWCAVCIPYFFWGDRLPGVLWHVEMAPTIVLSYLAGMGAPRGVFWGMPLSAETVFLLLVYGGSLHGARVIEMFIEIGKAAGNLVRGGIAYSAVVASSLVAMVTGEAISNVALSGSMTIPAMKARGFNAEESAAIEATASSGSQITPPIMSVAAFLMAVILNVAYVEILQRAVIPAILYFVGLSFGIYAMILANPRVTYVRERVDTKFIWVVLPSFVISMGVLIYLLSERYSVGFAAFWATCALLALSVFRPKAYRPTLGDMIRGVRDGAMVAASLAIALAAIGILIQTFLTTGLGIALGRLMTDASFGQLWIGLIIGSLIAILIGTALPTPAAYALCAVVIVPALINLGSQPLPAHFFALYWAAFSTLTPPVAMAVLAAVRISGGSHGAACWAAMKLSIVMFMLPFTYVLAPAILSFPTISVDTFIVSGIVLLAGICLSAALYGWLTFPLTLAERWLLALGPLSLFAHLSTGWAWLIAPPLVVLGGIALRRKLESKPLIAAARSNSQGGTP
jgi:TRAP transporter 4TM/12TM fusion protein